MRADLLPTTFVGSLHRLTEECGEVLFHVGKILRFGPAGVDGKTGVMYDNGAMLMAELEDLTHAIEATRKFYLGDGDTDVQDTIRRAQDGRRV